MSSLFLTHIKEQMWTKRYAKRTIESYLYWIKAFIIFNNKRHPSTCHNREVEYFLSHFAYSHDFDHRFSSALIT